MNEKSSKSEELVETTRKEIINKKSKCITWEVE